MYVTSVMYYFIFQIELKNKFKVRIFIDEACSFGVLGANGHGITEHYNIPVRNIIIYFYIYKINIP